MSLARVVREAPSIREEYRCDCHGKAVLATREGYRLVIRGRQFGEKHSLVIDLEREYNRAKELERQRSANNQSAK